MLDSISRLEDEIYDRWDLDLKHGHESQSTVRLQTDDLCPFADGCVSCNVERLARARAGARSMIALYRQRFETLREYQEVRAADEEEQKRYEAERQQAAEEERTRLRAEREAVLELEKQWSYSNGGRTPAIMTTFDDEYLDGMMERCEVLCTCSACNAEKHLQCYKKEAALARMSKETLQAQLGFRPDGKSTLELERERIREQVARDSPFGRTGSYRGFGAGALKPTRHLNSSGYNSNKEVEIKTGKKPKKPMLAR
ncbi:hypothetical protein LTR37_010830 [Vermiconidia calcicola]|uniref:Uncharacterized protein n=1 Tax=Vermiconidia calcicola TaxID=1690605 RepID=A0ACC3N5L1_9PEZI|nr:hypothetical protein LTR37_010830 [Vermiconidia calcicola]